MKPPQHPPKPLEILQSPFPKVQPTQPYLLSPATCDLFLSWIPTTQGLGLSYGTQLTLLCATSLLSGKLSKDRYVIFILASPLEPSMQQTSLNKFLMGTAVLRHQSQGLWCL